MAYDPTRQFRCDIVRTRAKKYIEEILSAYAKIIHDLCPCSEDEFIDGFNVQLKQYLDAIGQKADTKALNNHRTETAKTLFGMYFIDDKKVVYESQRTQKFLKDNDQPAFFKDICYKMQFPNGMTVNKNLEHRIENKIYCHPCRLVLAVLQEAQTHGIKLRVREIGYYILNSLDALKGKASAEEIVLCIENDRQRGVVRTIESGRNDPWDWEHIQGILNYLYLANLIEYSKSRKTRDREITLNTHEAATIKIFVSNCFGPLEFDVYDTSSFPRETVNQRKQFQLNWDKYNCELSAESRNFYTLPSCLGIASAASVAGVTKSKKIMTTAIGKAGESYVLDYEINLLKKSNPSLCSFVKNRADERGIGYDIESIELLGTKTAPKYIEVKTTTRITPPSGRSFIDVVNLTRNEWKAAQEHKSAFYVYRVYLTKGKVYIYQLKNILEKQTKSLVEIDAPIYEMRFDIGASGVIDHKSIV